jgi:hypothetical protein
MVMYKAQNLLRYAQQMARIGKAFEQHGTTSLL